MTQREQDQQFDDAPLTEEETLDASANPDMADTVAATQADPQTAEVEADTEADLEQRLAEEQDRSRTYLEELQRERASFINYRRRTEQEKEGWSRDANAALIFNVLPVLDDFERAKTAIPEDQQGTPWVEGLMLVGRKLYSTLELAGVKQIEAVGKPFDPSLHEAVMTESAGDAESGTVLEEYRKGYMLGDRVLRPSMVKVAQ